MLALLEWLRSIKQLFLLTSITVSDTVHLLIPALPPGTLSDRSVILRAL
jgi:hypothetical protein